MPAIRYTRFRLKRRACLFGSFAFPDDLSISNPYLAVGFRLLYCP
jgi:hypothetical protein